MMVGRSLQRLWLNSGRPYAPTPGSTQPRRLLVQVRTRSPQLFLFTFPVLADSAPRAMILYRNSSRGESHRRTCRDGNPAIELDRLSRSAGCVAKSNRS